MSQKEINENIDNTKANNQKQESKQSSTTTKRKK